MRFYNLDGFVKIRFINFYVIPAKAGIQLFNVDIDSRFRDNDGVSDFLLIHQSEFSKKGNLIINIPALTPDMITVFCVLGMVVVLLVFNLLRVDVVGLLVMTVLPLVGLLEGREAIAGQGSNAVVVLICVMVLGTSLDKTGVVGKIAQKIMKIAGKSEARVVTLLRAVVAFPPTSCLMSGSLP